jgi:outer membrane murein-binding lipoprotein Lpp
MKKGEEMKLKTGLIVALMMVSGCTTASKINRVSVGMTKREVIDLMKRGANLRLTLLKNE